MTDAELVRRLRKEAFRSWRSQAMAAMLLSAASKIEGASEREARHLALVRDMQRRLPKPWGIHLLEHGTDDHGRWRWACILYRPTPAPDGGSTLSSMGIGDTPERALADAAAQERLPLIYGRRSDA